MELMEGEWLRVRGLARLYSTLTTTLTFNPFAEEGGGADGKGGG